MNTYQVIDEKNWERAMHCMVFRESVEPAFCVTFEVDITNFRRKVKAQNLSFTLAFVYAVCKCANEIEAFRYRFLDGRVVLFDHIDTAFTYLNQDTGLFKMVNVPLQGSILGKYRRRTSYRKAKVRQIIVSACGNGCLYHSSRSCIPFPIQRIYPICGECGFLLWYAGRDQYFFYFCNIHDPAEYTK